MQQLKSAKQALSKWNKEIFGSVQSKIKLLTDQLEYVQRQVPSDLGWEAEKRLEADIMEALRVEESFWK